jgi:GTP cyclohydrolase I
MALPDLQSSPDLRGVKLERVGIEGVKFPIRILKKALDPIGYMYRQQGASLAVLPGVTVDVQAVIDMYASVSHDQRGTNMSRFLEVLMDWRFQQISSVKIPTILKDLQDRLKSSDVYIAIEFDYFIDVKSPVTGLDSVDDIHCELVGIMRDGSDVRIIEGLTMVGTNCCPCSKEISDRGAHNQRVELRVRYEPKPGQFLWFEDMAERFKSTFSCPIFPLLKRPDEKYVTEQAYDHPKFSEDVAREAALILQELSVLEWQVKVVAQESIHHHNAITYVASPGWKFHR